MTETKNIKQTVRKTKTEDGEVVEKIVVDKDTNEVKEHTIKDEKGNDVKPNVANDIKINSENAAIISTKLLEGIYHRMGIFQNILNQMIEMNYYMAHLEPEDSRKEGKIKEHFEKLGIKLNG